MLPRFTGANPILKKQDNPNFDDRIAALESRVAKLEEDARLLRFTVKRKTMSFHEALRDKFRPKIEDHRHYWPRELHIPKAYSATTVPHLAPTIAIVSPSLNQAEFIGATIDSVLGQNYPMLKYHVQDGGSSDGTTDVLKRYDGRLTWCSVRDRGQSEAVNSGFRSVEGEIMAYLNTDDLLMPGTLAYVARAFSADPGLDVVYGHRICIDNEGNDIGRWILPRHDPTAIKWFDFVPQETMFWRRRVWNTLGGLDESFQFAMDWDFILRAHAKGMRFARLPRFLGCFRVHDRQKSSRIYHVGEEESRRLRLVHLGYDPNPVKIRKAKAAYFRRHILYHRLYKLRLLHY